MWIATLTATEILDSGLSAIMIPELFEVIALLAALSYTLRSARRDGLELRAMYWAGASAILLGLWGGYLLGFVYYGTDGRPWAWLRFWSGGEAQYGGLLAGALAVAAYLRIRKQLFLRYADAMAPAVALGVAVGRIGCFLNGDDFGTLTQLPWGVRFPPGTEAYADHFARGWIAPGAEFSQAVHPVQLYASLLALALFMGLVHLRESAPGTRLAVLACVHGATRFFIQYWRGDFERVLGPFSLTQLLSLGLVLLGGGFLIVQSLRSSAALDAPTALQMGQGGR
ncbi:MAG TPA: prolipoprotein diacylglyceryl transferase family protein [Candidatus Limnocylindrales bacterium]|nr:prolipoprotein diacylglyceryl transferase family protein [Candidatus Limnocylindrales bacterium]